MQEFKQIPIIIPTSFIIHEISIENILYIPNPNQIIPVDIYLDHQYSP